LENEILKDIKEKCLAPTPRWCFLWKNYAFWGLGLLILVFGSMATSVALYLVFNNDWEVYSQAGSGFLSFLLSTLPYLWIAIIIIFALAAFYEVRQTTRGYKFQLTYALGGIFILSIIVGGLFYWFGLAQVIDDELAERVPYYERVVNPQLNYWMSPGEGRLVGMIKRKENADTLILADLENKEWKVKITNGEKFIASVPLGLPVRLIGREISSNEFIASRVLSSCSGRGFFRRFED